MFLDIYSYVCESGPTHLSCSHIYKALGYYCFLQIRTNMKWKIMLLTLLGCLMQQVENMQIPNDSMEENDDFPSFK